MQVVCFLQFILIVLLGLMFFKLLAILHRKNILTDDDIHFVTSFILEHKKYLEKKIKLKLNKKVGGFLVTTLRPSQS